MDKQNGNVRVLISKDQLLMKSNTVKKRFLPKDGQIIILPNGAAYKVSFINEGKLRFTADFDCVIAPAEKGENRAQDKG